MRPVRLFLLCILAALPAGAVPAPKLVVSPAPAGEKASPDYTLAVEGRPVFVYTADVLHGGPASFASFDFAGRVRVIVTSTRPVSRAVVRPLALGVVPEVAGNRISFALSRPCNLSLELNGGLERPLLLFANPLETNPPRPDDPNVIYFGPGVHEVNTTTPIPSGKTLYLAGGAIVRAKILPDEKPVVARDWSGQKVYKNLFVLDGVKGVTVRGRGILDLSALPWHARNPLVIRNSSDVRVEGIIIKDSPSWCVALFGSKNVTITNIKEICHRENSDGIDVCNSQDVVIDGCFLRNNDDEICLKAPSPRPAQDTANVLVKNCVIWNDRAYALGITYETRVGIHDATFRDCDVIHDTGIASLAIHVSDSGTMSGIRFEEVRVEDTRNRLIRLWIGKDFWGHDPERGHIRGVTFRNVAVVDGPEPASEIAGADPEHAVEDVTFERLRLRRKLAGSLAQARIGANAHTHNLRFVADETPPAAAPALTEIRALPGDPRIRLVWKPVEDPESGIDHYNLYRDGRKVAEADGASYTDGGLPERTRHTYRIAAVNGSDLEGPRGAEGSAVTLRDTGAPRVARVDAEDATHLRVSFSEPVLLARAARLADYAVEPMLRLVAAAPAPDGRSVLLETARLEEGRPYRLRVDGVTDRAAKPNRIAPGAVAFVYSAGLVGYWKLDDGQGATAADSSGNGNHGALRNLAPARAWVAGKRGGALECDGASGYVEIPNSAALARIQEGSYTVAAWFRPKDTPLGTGNVYNSGYAIVMKRGYHEGLLYNQSGRFVLCHWLSGDKGVGATSALAYPPGEFYHVAGVVDRVMGECRLYVNGQLVGQEVLDPAAQSRPYGDEPWRIGVANPSTREGYAWPARGVIDDVRLYRRALSGEEIRALSGE